jgi:hypothetical protein
MVNPERTPLFETVEVDECFVGGLDRELRGGRQHGTKALVVVAVEVRGAGSAACGCRWSRTPPPRP